MEQLCIPSLSQKSLLSLSLFLLSPSPLLSSPLLSSFLAALSLRGACELTPRGDRSLNYSAFREWRSKEFGAFASSPRGRVQV